MRAALAIAFPVVASAGSLELGLRLGFLPVGHTAQRESATLRPVSLTGWKRARRGGSVLWRIGYQDFTEDNGANEVLEARKRKFLVTLSSGLEALRAGSVSVC
jgi:hypothetical protein